MVIFIFMKVAMWTLELGLSRQIVQVAPVARPGYPRVCGRKKSPEGVPPPFYDCNLIFWYRVGVILPLLNLFYN
jgi:hypothetical protein